jgi:hypothetical protein
VAPWVRALTVSRWWRAAAFDRVRQGDRAGAAHALDLAYAADDDCGRLAADRHERHCVTENRRLLFDVTVKAGASVSTPERLAAAVAGLLELDGAEPSARFHVAALAARGGDLGSAAAGFDRAGMAGTIRGAAGAARAAGCWEQVGAPDRARRSWDLLRDLDPAARIPDPAVGSRE